jgi:dTDP-4-dehydrorhamnose 3,5-epimerase
MPEVAELEGMQVADPDIFRDARGQFWTWFAGGGFVPEEGTCSVSRQGVARGIHHAPGRAKVVTCLSGTILDFAVDLRAGSPTFMDWKGVQLDESNRRVARIAEGFGHAFLALTDAIVCYLYTGRHDPAAYYAVSMFDPGIGITWPVPSRDLIVSDKDALAPLVAATLGNLPRYVPGAPGGCSYG